MSSPRRRELTRAIIAALQICVMGLAGRHPRQVAIRAFEVPQDRRVDRIAIGAMLAFKFPLGLQESGLGLYVLAAGMLEAVAANRPRHRGQATGSKRDDNNGRHHGNCADLVRGFSDRRPSAAVQVPQTEDCGGRGGRAHVRSLFILALDMLRHPPGRYYGCSRSVTILGGAAVRLALYEVVIETDT